MTRILAIDLAGKAGVCDWKVGEKPTFYTIQIGAEDEEGFDAWRRKSVRAMRWIASRLQVNDIDDVVIEAPRQGGWGDTNANTTASTFILLGAILGPVGLRSVTCSPGKVQTVRKHFIGHGNLRKEVAKPRVRQTCEAIGWSVKNYDESDAGALAHWRAAKLGLNHLIPDVRPFHRAAP